MQNINKNLIIKNFLIVFLTKNFLIQNIHNYIYIL